MGTRPIGVTVIAVLSVIVGVLQVIGAIAFLAGLTAAPLWQGIFYLVIGVATIAVGIGLFRGNPLARTLATIVFVLGIVSDIATVFVNPGAIVAAIIGAVFRIIAIVLLYTRPANAFFGR